MTMNAFELYTYLKLSYSFKKNGIQILITNSISRAVVRELVETEEEFGRDMQQVVSRYMKPTDKATTPKPVFDNRELLFSNFRQICEFHNTWVLV